MELAALILSGIAIIVSVIFGIRQLKLGSDQHDLAARLGAIEEARRTEELDARARADLTARYEERPGHAGQPSYLFVVDNRGPARATVITFDITAIGQGDAPVLHAAPKLIPALDAGQQFTVPAVFWTGLADSVRVTLNWTDDAGPQTKDVVLSTFI